MASGNDLATGDGKQGELVATMLTGSQRKTAYALRQNVESLIAGHNRRTLRETVLTDGRTVSAWQSDAPDNLHCVGFLTLTVGDTRKDLSGKNRFEQVFDAAEASRRINNLNRRFLADLFSKAIVVTERHKNKAIHFHIVGLLRSRADIRTGFDFEAFKEIRKSGKKFSAADVGASPELATIWKQLRETLPGYGFGRAELTPIEKAGESIASYVAKYIEKNVCNRIAADRRKKLVRYIGFEKTQLKPNEFSWGTKRAIAWRCKARAMAAVAGIKEKEQCKVKFGGRWAWQFTGTWTEIFGDNTLPWLAFEPQSYLETLSALDKMEKAWQQKWGSGFTTMRFQSELREYEDYERTPENKRAAWRCAMQTAREIEREDMKRLAWRQEPISDEDFNFANN